MISRGHSLWFKR